MKEYRLLSWPDLPSEFRRIAFRRLLSEMSQRHISEPQLLKRDGVKPAEVRALLQFLAKLDLLDVRESAPAGKWRPSLSGFSGWLRRLTA